MPQRSRTTRTGADSPATVSVPDVIGVSGAGGGAVRAHAATATSTTSRARPCLRVFVANNFRGYTIRMAIKDGLLAEFDHEMGTTRKLLDRVPEDNPDRLSWKPHARSMSLGGLCTHLANLP